MEDAAAAERASARRAGTVVGVVYAALALLLLVEKPGRATSDTRLELTEDPGGYLAGTFSLWNPDVSLGELQNQAYGYLFPQGSFFALLDLIGVESWVSQRIWSALVLVVACEGLRRVGRRLGLSPWAAAAAGLAYGLVPRHVSELGVRSAEILPGAVLPWALLPILAAVDRRLRPRDAAVLSAAAFACSGGVNGTATAAPCALLVVVVGWAVVTKHLSWRFALGWGALIAAVSVWWVVSLLRLGAYSPPFFDYVEDAPTTTATSGFSAVLRGASNWVSYLVVGGERWWPAGYELVTNPWLVLGSGLVAVLGVLGLLRYRGRFRTPLLLAAGLGLTCQVIAHTAALDSPLSPWLQDLLDGPLAPLRNVPKADPILRLPLALGVGVLADDLVRVLLARRPPGWRGIGRRAAAGGLAATLVAGLFAMAWPITEADTRTPGWEQVPSYWTEAAAFLEEESAQQTWVIPGSGFGIQPWGWTMEETMQAVARSPWVTRSQVPLTPAGTIRMLSTLEAYLETGAGSPYLALMLERIGIDTVLVRHDLDPEVSQATPASLVAVALARSPGIDRVAAFGQLEFGPAIEVFEVEGADRTPADRGYDVRDTADAVTVASSVEDAVGAVGAGLVGPAQPIVIEGAEGWDAEADVLGDGWRLRERAFGRIHDGESNVMAIDDAYRAGRVLPDYPGPVGADPVVAEYDGIVSVDASSSRGWADALGQVRPENAPWSAIDGDPTTYWQPAPFLAATEQWIEVDLGEERRVDEVVLQEPTGVLGIDEVDAWRVSAGGVSETVRPERLTGRATVYLGGVRADSVRVSVAAAPSDQATLGLSELTIDDLELERTLRVPDVPLVDDPDLVFTARQEARACVTTLLGPDCDPYRQRASEEAGGIDRTFDLDASGTFRVTGLAVARSRPGTVELLRPQGTVSATGSSWLAQDPTVSPRMAYDDDPSTAWVADPRDPEPSLTFDLGRVRTIRRIDVTPTSGLALPPETAVVARADGTGRRKVSLDGYGAIEPLRARRVTVTFDHGTDAGEGDRPLGIAEVRLGGGRNAVPLPGGEETGAVCGFGPPLLVDGRRYRTRVRGNVGAIIAAGQLAVRPCGEARRGLDLSDGEHRVRLLSTEQFQPVAMVLRSRGGAERVDRSRPLSVESLTDTRVVLDVGPGEDAIISTPHNENPGWVATVDGEELEPIEVDGWAQGWQLPEEVSGEVELIYAPQRGYLVGLVGGLALLGVVLLWAVAILVISAVRARTAVSGGDRTSGPDGATLAERLPARGAVVDRRGGSGRPVAFGRLRLRAVGLVVGAGVVGWLIGGPLVALGAAAGVLLSRWPRVVQGLVGLGLVVALGILVVALLDEPQSPSDAVDLMTGAALAIGLGAAARGRPGET